MLDHALAGHHGLVPGGNNFVFASTVLAAKAGVQFQAFLDEFSTSATSYARL